MKKRFSIIMVLLIAVCALTLAACSGGISNLFGGNSGNTTTNTTVSVTSIQITDTVIYMSPTGTTSTVQLEPTVLPENATNKKLSYQVLSATDMQYLMVSASGLMTAKSEKKEGYVTVRIFAQDNRNVYIDLSVYVQVVALEKISFNTSAITVKLNQTGENRVKVEPILSPVNATLNGDLQYTSLDTDVCTIDKNGYITPVSVGQTTIQVATVQTSSLDEPIVGNIEVNVTYSELAYNLTASSDASVFKQIYNSPELIELTLVGYDGGCDPNPTIIWYCDETALNAYRNNKICSYSPSDVPVGEHYLYAKLTDASGTVVISDKFKLNIYNALAGVDLTLTTGTVDDFTENDIAGITVSIVENQYPPEQYNWYLKGANADGTDKLIGVTQTAVYNYQISDNGDLTVICEPVIKGTAQVALREEISLGLVGAAPVTGCDIYGAYVEGGKLESDYLPFIYWQPVAYNTKFTVQIDVDGTITEMASDSVAYGDYFRRYGCFIPASIAELDDTFKVRIKSEDHNYSNWINYAADVNSSMYSYLEEIIPNTGMNGYISNMEEFGELLNYINIFRPSYLYYEASSNPVLTGQTGYSFKIFTELQYSSLDSSVYPVLSDPDPTDPVNYQNVHCLVSACFNCYCDSSSFSYVRTVDAAGNVCLVMDFKDVISDYTQTEDSALVEVYAAQHYATELNKRTSNVLPIDSITQTISVTTSNQLYLALSMGYRPVPTTGSAAEEIYAIMRNVLKRINSDLFTDEQKVHAIYDFLSTEVTYDYAVLSILDSATQRKCEAFFLEGVFLRNQAVCDGIAKAFNSLCWMEGIVSVKVSGEEDVNHVGHAWNKVMIDGEWYGIDATWGSTKVNATQEAQTHAYLLVTDAVLNEKHETYGKTPSTVTVSSDVYYGAEVATGVTSTLTTAAEVQAFTTGYIATKLTAVGNVVRVEVMLDGISKTTYEDTVGKNLGINCAIGISNVRDNIYLYTYTRNSQYEKNHIRNRKLLFGENLGSLQRSNRACRYARRGSARYLF